MEDSTGWYGGALAPIFVAWFSSCVFCCEVEGHGTVKGKGDIRRSKLERRTVAQDSHATLLPHFRLQMEDSGPAQECMNAQILSKSSK